MLYFKSGELLFIFLILPLGVKLLDILPMGP